MVDASGDLTGIGIPIPEAHVVFASAAVSDFELAPGLSIDLPQGITGVGTIDLGQPVADLLNEAFSPPTPILPTVVVTISFGTAIEIRAAISLGGDGATLFIGCPGGGTSCNPTAPTTTRLALTSAFIRLTIGGAGGFSIGFGGDGTLQLPPAQGGTASPPLNLHVEASIQPPARVGLAMFFEGALQNAMGLQGLTLSNLGIQGSIDFSTTPVPLVTIGITGQVDRVPNQLASVFGLTNNGEPMRFTLNVDPLAPILELTLGVDNGQIVARPLAALGQGDALEVDFASVVIAPLGGTVGPVTYSPGVSAGFRANILGVLVNVNASVDLPAAHLNGTVEVGALTIGGVRFEDTTILIDITPASFRQTLCGGVQVGATALQGLLHIQAGGGGGGPATCGDVSLEAGTGAGLNARFRLSAAALPIGVVTVEDFLVDAQAELDALSANFNATLNVSGRINVLANNLAIDGSVRFDSTGVKELHVKAIGNVNVGGVQITGDGSCPFPAAVANIPGAPRAHAAVDPSPPRQGASGACVQLDHAPGTAAPFRFGLKGALTAAGSTASVTGTIDQSRTSLTGSLNVPTLGTLDISGTLVFGGGGTIANATGANVSASPGDWRVSGRFGSSKELADDVSARWSFVAGRVSGGFFVRGSADANLAGVSVQLAGTFSSSGSNLTYELTGSSSAAVNGAEVGLAKTGGGAFNFLHSAIRAGVFNFPGLSPIGGRNSDENFPETMKGRLHFDASYNVEVTLTQGGLDIDEADIAAKVVYGERFDRDGNGAFGEESRGQAQHPRELQPRCQRHRRVLRDGRVRRGDEDPTTRVLLPAVRRGVWRLLMTHTTNHDLGAELEAQREEIEALRAELAEQRSVVGTLLERVVETSDGGDPAMSRRRFFTTGAAAVAGGMAGAVLCAPTSGYADTGDPIILGQTNTGGNTTVVDVTGVNTTMEIRGGVDGLGVGAGTALRVEGGGSLGATALVVTNTATFANLAAIRADADGTSGATFGVRGTNDSTTADAVGVQGEMVPTSGATFGVRGKNASTTTDAAGVRGDATGTTGATVGVHATNASSAGTAIEGAALATTGTTTGVLGTCAAPAGNGVLGQATTTSGSGAATGVKGTTTSTNVGSHGVHGTSTATTANSSAVRGDANGATGATRGVHGTTASTSSDAAGVRGDVAAGFGAGVHGTTSSTNSFTAAVRGDVLVSSAVGTTAVLGNNVSNGTGAIGVRGECTSTSGASTGVQGSVASVIGTGVVGTNTASGGKAILGTAQFGYGLTGSGGLAPLRLVPGQTAGAPTSGLHLAGEIFVDSAGNLFLNTTQGTPGTWTQLNNQSGGGGGGLTFTPLAAPVRIYYSLAAGHPPLANGQERSVQVTNGGTIPHTVAAVLTNLAVTETAAGGFLAMFKHGTAWPGTSNLNFPPGGFASNNATSAVALDAGVGKVTVRCGGATAHFVIDVFGYFA